MQQAKYMTCKNDRLYRSRRDIQANQSLPIGSMREPRKTNRRQEKSDLIGTFQGSVWIQEHKGEKSQVGVIGRELRRVGEMLCAWDVGMWSEIKRAKTVKEGCRSRERMFRVDGCPERHGWCPDKGSVHAPMWPSEEPTQVHAHCLYHSTSCDFSRHSSTLNISSLPSPAFLSCLCSSYAQQQLFCSYVH
jgi:hypothetical protein